MTLGPPWRVSSSRFNYISGIETPLQPLSNMFRQGTRNWLGAMGSPRWGPRSGLAKPSWEKSVSYVVDSKKSDPQDPRDPRTPKKTLSIKKRSIARNLLGHGGPLGFGPMKQFLMDWWWKEVGDQDLRGVSDISKHGDSKSGRFHHPQSQLVDFSQISTSTTSNSGRIASIGGSCPFLLECWFCSKSLGSSYPHPPAN